IKPAGTCPRASSCRPISPSFCCRRSAQSSTRSRTSGSSCATTGSPTASSNPTTISSTIVVRHGTSSSISLGASCPSDCAKGPTGSDQWDLDNLDNSSAGAQRPPPEVVADMAQKFTVQIYCQGVAPKTATGTAGTLAPSDVADFGTKFDVQPMPGQGSTRP